MRNAPKTQTEQVEALIKLLKDIRLLIEDNNQNVRDCVDSLKSLENILVPKKTWRERLRKLWS